MAYIEIGPQGMRTVGAEAGDVVEVYNDFGSTFVSAWPS